MNRHDRVLAIVLAAEHLLCLARINGGREILETLRQIVADRLSGFGPLDEDGEVVSPSFQGCAEIAVLLQAPAALEQFLRRPLVLPEVRIRYALFYV